jgi:hypothetical protein
MKFKIQFMTMFGWMNLMGEFDTIQEAQEKIPWLQSMIAEGDEEILRIVKVTENPVTDKYMYLNS